MRDRKKYSLEEISLMNNEELDRAMDEVSEILVSLRSQVESAKSDGAIGNYHDISWFNKTKYALRAKGREHQMMLQEKSKRNKNRQNSFERRFVQNAKLILDPDVFNSIIDLSINEIDTNRDANAMV